MVFFSYRLGLIINHFTQKNSKVEIFLFGLITFYATMQLVGLPFVLFHLSFNLYFITQWIIFILLVFLSFWLVRIKEEKQIWLTERRKKENKTKKEKYISIILNVTILILVLGQAFVSSFLFRENADDSYYVSLATQSIEDEKLYQKDPSLGMEKDYSLLSSFEQITTYELGMAMMAKTVGIPPVILFHSLLPIITIIFAYLAFYYLASQFMNPKQAKLFIVVLAVIFLFSGFTSKFRTGCLLAKAWQGKAIFLTVGLTVLMGLLLKNKKRKQEIWLIAITNIACVFLSSSAIFINSFLYLGFGLIALVKKRGKEIVKLICSFIPVFLYAIILLILMKISPLHTEITFTEQNLFDLLMLYGSKAYLILYAISLIIILLWGNQKGRKLLVAIPIIYFLTILNPFLLNFIAKYLTSSVTFWRVLWLLPIEISIGYAVVLLVDKAKLTKPKSIILAGSLLLIMISGKFIYQQENNFHLPQNAEKIPQEIVEQTNYILNHSENNDKIMVLAPGEPLHSCTMRQLTDKIELLYSRWMYFDDLISPEEIEERKALCQIYLIGVPNYDQEEFKQKIKRFDVEWIIVPDNNEALTEYLENTRNRKTNQYSRIRFISNQMRGSIK